MSVPLKDEGVPFAARSLELPPSLWQRLEDEVPESRRLEFVSAAVEEKLERQRWETSQEAPPVWEVVTSIFVDLPEEDRERLPADLSENLDHYLYGIVRK